MRAAISCCSIASGCAVFTGVGTKTFCGTPFYSLAMENQMFFRNLTMFQFPQVDLSTLNTQLDDCRLKPVGPLDMSSRGFVSPLGRDSDALVHQIGDCLLLAIGGEDKILPASVVNEWVAKKADEIEDREGQKLGLRARKRLKDDVLLELLPRAFSRPSRCLVHIDAGLGVVFVDTSSRKVGEECISEIRHGLGSFPAVPVNAEVNVKGLMTSWLADGDLPEGLTLGDECELRDPTDGGSTLRVTRQELEAEEIAKHLEVGKLCSRLALSFNNHITFVLCEDLVVRKLKFLDGAIESMPQDIENAAAELDARYALMCGELKQLYKLLAKAFQITSTRQKELAPREGVQQRMPDVDGGQDPLYADAVKSVLESRIASVSGLQRRMRIGYNRAARLIEAMEAEGVVSNDRGDRTVLRSA